MDLKIKEVKTTAEMEEVFKLRENVFVEEQGVPLSIERDSYDKEAGHVIAKYEGETVACGRIVFADDGGKIGRVAVAQSFRKQGIGRKVCQKLLEIAKEKSSEVVLHAQVDSIDFYKKLGFKEIGDEFIEADIKHMKMQYTKK